MLKGIGRFLKSDDFKIGTLVAILSILVVIATASVYTLFKGIIPLKVGVPVFTGIIILFWSLGLLKE